MLEILRLESGVVRIRGRLDASESDRALSELQRYPGPLTVDCGELEYISSAGISVVMQTWKRLNAQGSKLVLTGVTPRVRNVFLYAGLDKILEL